MMTNRKVLRNGYVMVKIAGHPKADRWGWIMEHRVVME